MSEEKESCLIMTPKDKIEEWKNIVEKAIKDKKDVIVFFDTETTGGVRKGSGVSAIEKDDMKYYGKRHRMVEIGARVCIKDEDNNIINLTDSDGNKIFFHEYLNPWRENEIILQKFNIINEVPWGAYLVHGISRDFLYCNEYLGQKKRDDMNSTFHINQFKLPRPAPTFGEVIEEFMNITGLSCEINFELGQKHPMFVAHNNEFDNKMMHNEFKILGLNSFESYIRPFCTLEVSRELLPKSYISGKGLSNLFDSLTNYGLITKHIDRTLHGALVDVDILQEVFQAITKTSYYKNAKNTPTYEKVKNKNEESELIKQFLLDKQRKLPLISNTNFTKRFSKK